MKNYFAVVFKKLFDTVFIFVFEKVKKLKKNVWYSFHFCFWKNEKRRWGERGEKRRNFFFKNTFYLFSVFFTFFQNNFKKFWNFFPKTLYQTCFQFLFSIFSTQKLKNSFWDEKQTWPYFPATKGTPLRALGGKSPCNPEMISVIALTTFGSSL